MTHEEYLASAGLGSSALNALSRSPWHYWAEFLAPERPQRKSTPAMDAGTLAHCAILEPYALHDRYAVKPEGHDGRTKDGKQWLESVNGRIVISSEQLETAKAQRAAVLAVPELAQLLSRGEPEKSVDAIDDETGVACKARIDWVHPLPDGRVILLDLKTSADPTPDGFARSVWTYGYHRQDAHYRAVYEHATGNEVAAFVFAAVSSAYPFLAVAHMLDDDALARGQANRRALLRLYAECAAKNEWPRPFAGLNLLSLPAWAKETA